VLLRWKRKTSGRRVSKAVAANPSLVFSLIAAAKLII